MKVILKGLAAALTASFLFAGCDMLNPKPKDDKGGNKGGTSGGGNQQADSGPDMTAYLSAYSPQPLWPKDPSVIKAGWFYEKSSDGPGGKNKTKWACVAQAGDQWKVETNEATVSMNLIEALVIGKDGKITEAYAGKAGKDKVKKIKITEGQAGDSPQPQESDEQVSVKAGTYASKKSVVKDKDGKVLATTWTGIDGDTKGVLLKFEPGTAGAPYELNALEMVDWKCGANGYKAKHLTYSNGQEMWWIADNWPIVGGEGGTIVKMAMTTPVKMTWEITNVGSDAKPELSWEVAK